MEVIRTGETLRIHVPIQDHFPTHEAGIVTNNFHLFRGLQMARNAGITDACGIAAGSNKVFLVNNMMREYLGEVKYWIHRIF